ncbi:MAG: lipid-A-disaccharide synthase [Bacteroidales bacterium]|nr:lipid-A-disaccharide synthase [Bacteroidales bacterium]
MNKNKKYYIVAGEASGDLQASRLMKGIKEINPNVEFRFLGGDLMLAQGGTLIKHYREMAFMGLDVVKNIRTIKRNMTLSQKDILDWQPDAVILVDYPGINLRIAEFAHKAGIKVYYYISPKVWVWKKNRIKKIKKFIDKMFVIFPFEVDFYKGHDYKVYYQGNPTLDIVHEELSKNLNKELFLKENNLTEKPIIALLPGSRAQEVAKIMPEMVKAIKQFRDYQFVVAGVTVLNEEVYRNLIAGTDIKLVFDKTYDLLQVSYAAVVTSGTATLETGLFKVPQVVCYKTGKLSYAIGKRLVNFEFFSLVNILMKKEVVKEFLQNNLVKDIISELKRLTEDENYRLEMKNNYQKLTELLGESGSPKRTAELILKD